MTSPDITEGMGLGPFAQEHMSFSSFLGANFIQLSILRFVITRNIMNKMHKTLVVNATTWDYEIKEERIGLCT